MAAGLNRCHHCQLSEEESLLNRIISACIPLPKFHPNLAELELDSEREPTPQPLGSPEDIQMLSDLMIIYAEKSYNVNRQITGENMVNFALKYRLDAQVVGYLLENGAAAQDPDQLGFTPFRVAILDLPNSKPSLLKLLKYGLEMTIEICDDDKMKL